MIIDRAPPSATTDTQAVAVGSDRADGDTGGDGESVTLERRTDRVREFRVDSGQDVVGHLHDGHVIDAAVDVGPPAELETLQRRRPRVPLHNPYGRRCSNARPPSS